MSVVTKVLSDLDARKAAPDNVAGLALHMTAARANHHEGFWRAVVVLMVVGLGCVAYLAYALRPRAPVATQLAYQYAGQIVRKPPTAIEAALAALPEAVPAALPEKPAAPAAIPEAPAVQKSPGAEALKLAWSIDTPLAERPGQRSGSPDVSGLAAPGKASSGSLDAREQARLHHLLGNVLASLSRHEEAVGAYKAALEGAPQNGGLWLALAMSLDELGRRPDAAEAYGRALATGSLEQHERALAEQRAARLR